MFDAKLFCCYFGAISSAANCGVVVLAMRPIVSIVPVSNVQTVGIAAQNPHHVSARAPSHIRRPGSLPNAPPRAHPSGQHSPSQCDVPYGLPFARSYGSSWNDHDNHAGTSDGSAQDGAGTNAYSRGSATSSLRASGKPSPLSHSFGSGGGSHPLRVSFLHSKLSPNTASDGLSDSHQSLASQDLYVAVCQIFGV